LAEAERFGTEGLYSDVVHTRDVASEAKLVQRETFDEVLWQTDMLSLPVRATAHTRGLIDRHTITKPGAILVYAARGSLWMKTHWRSPMATWAPPRWMCLAWNRLMFRIRSSAFPTL